MGAAIATIAAIALVAGVALASRTRTGDGNHSEPLSQASELDDKESPS